MTDVIQPCPVYPDPHAEEIARLVGWIKRITFAAPVTSRAFALAALALDGAPLSVELPPKPLSVKTALARFKATPDLLKQVREALEPFAKECENYEPTNPYVTWADIDRLPSLKNTSTVGDLRRARAALAALKGATPCFPGEER